MTDKPRTELDELRELSAMERRQQAETERFFESKQSGEAVTLTPEQVKARGRRNLWIALSVGAFIVLVFFITMAKVGDSIAAGSS